MRTVPATLIRGVEGYDGPGKLTKALGIDRSLNREDILSCPALRIEDDGAEVNITSLPRVGIGYADEADRDALWRFRLKKS